VAAPLLGSAGPIAQAVAEPIPVTPSRVAWALLAALLVGMTLVGVWPGILAQTIGQSLP
jgi:hypothetical protein